MDNQKQFMLAGAGAAIVVIALALVLLRGGTSDQSAAQSASAGISNPTAASAQSPGSQLHPGGQPPGKAAPAGGISPAPAAAKPAPTYAIAHRPDPFKVPWTKPTPPPPVLGVIQPIRVASADVEAPPPPNTIVHEVPSRRVSGILTGDGVYAVLESGDNSEIVKPGSVTSDGYRVTSITGDSVVLQRRDGNVLRTQVVPLSDVTSPPLAPVGGAGPQGPAGGKFGNLGGAPGGKFGNLGGIGARPGAAGGGGVQ